MRTYHNPKYSTRITQVQGDAVILRKNDWRRAKKEAVFLTPEQILEKTQNEEFEKQKTMHAIDAKRTQIVDAEIASQQRAKQQATALSEQKREAQLAIARAKANEELDEVKLMNQEVAAARTRTIRDAELLLHKKRQQEEREREKREAEELEKERQRALQIYKEREDALREQRKLGAQMILKQIEDRKGLKGIEEARRKKEIQEMMEANQLAIEEERRLAQERRQRQQDFLQECLEANKQSILRKQREKEREVEEINAIAEYQRQKAAREAEYERTVAERKAQKELEIAEVRRKQQRLIDTQAEIDELRARRVQEETERKARQKELEEARKKQEEREMIIKDREQFLRLKQKRLVQLANIERQEFEQAKAAAEKERAAREEEQRKKRLMAQQYTQQLQEEIEMKRQQKAIEPLVHLDEQQHLAEERQDYMERIEQIRQEKLAMLRAEGVPEKYLTDLANRRFVIK